MKKWSIKVSVDGKEIKPEKHTEHVIKANKLFQELVTQDYGGLESNGTRQRKDNPPDDGSFWTKALEIQDALYYASPDFGRKK